MSIDRTTDTEALTPDKIALTKAVKDSLTAEFIRDALGSGLQAYRARLLTIEVVVFCMLEMLLRGLPSLGALIRRLRMGKLSSVAALNVSRQAFYKRLETLPHTLFLRLLQHVVTALRPEAKARQELSRLVPFAPALVAVDDTTLDALAKKSDAFEHIGTGTCEGLAGRLGCMIDLTTGLFRAVAYDSDANGNERHRLMPLLATLPAGTLVVFDLGYFAFDLFDAVGERWLYFITRMKSNVRYRVIHTMVDSPVYRDQLVWLGSEKGTESMRWPVRLIEVCIGEEWWSYVTNMWDPCFLPAERVMRIYEARWSIERAFYAIKRALGLHSLYPCHLNGLLIQIWCTLILYQLLQTLRSFVARECRWEADEVSWPMLLQAVAMYGEEAQPVPLKEWLLTNAKELALRVRDPQRRKRIIISAKLSKALALPKKTIPLHEISPQKSKRRKYRYEIRPSKKFFANFFDNFSLESSYVDT